MGGSEMKTSVLDARSLILAPIVFLIGYLVSLPVYYFGLTWREGMYTFYIENTYISVFAFIGFFGYRWLDRICKDGGEGNLYLCATLLVLFSIIFGFQGKEVYAINIARLYPGGLKYKTALSFEDGLTEGSLIDLMKFSSVYICTYAASVCLIFAMFCRARCNVCVPIYIAELKRRYLKWTGKLPYEEERESSGESDEFEEYWVDDDGLDSIFGKNLEAILNEDMEAGKGKEGTIRCVGEVLGQRSGEDNAGDRETQKVSDEDGFKNSEQIDDAEAERSDCHERSERGCGEDFVGGHVTGNEGNEENVGDDSCKKPEKDDEKNVNHTKKAV